MFTVLVCLKEVGTFDKFQDALKLFITKVKEMVQNGTTIQVLESSNFISYRGQPMNFYQARDFAYEVGLMNDGELVEPAPEVPESTIIRAFSVATAQNLAATTF